MTSEADDLDPKTKLAMQAYGGRLIAMWAGVFGVANVVALVAAFGWLYSVVADTATQKVLASARLEPQLQAARDNLSRIIGRTDAVSDAVAELAKQAATVEQQLKATTKEDVALLAPLATALKGNNTVQGVLDALAKPRALECTNVEKRSLELTEMNVEAKSDTLVAQGYRLVSGGCRYDRFENADKTLALTNAPSETGGWTCWYKNPRATTVTATARYCRVAA
jgi:hypothetical protein